MNRDIAKRRIKAALGHLLYRGGLYKPLWRHRAMIVVFHRVDDRYAGDGITCSRAQFAAFCDFFARYFEVVPLSELVDLLRRGADVSRRLVITFDDGYRDNYQVAAVELRKRGLPACFFVTTGFVGTDRVAWWDAQQSVRSEWMTWDNVRSLRAQGFELGAHTVTHADLGRLSGAEATREIADSKARLEAELRTGIRHFAYPYGEPDHMTEENRAAVRDAGFSCCVSGHGGVVRPADSPFRLTREPINTWYFSPYQFGFEALRTVLSRTVGRKPLQGMPGPAMQIVRSDLAEPVSADRSNGNESAPDGSRNPVRILCNRRWFEGRAFGDRPVESTVVSPGGLLSAVRLFFVARRCDAAVFNCDERRLLLVCLLGRIFGMKRCRLVSVDIHLDPPRTRRERLRARVIGWLLREVALFIGYFKETGPMRRAYGLERQRFAYVPFKVNRSDLVRAAKPTDGGFALVCGRSDRDYRMLAAAAAGLDVPIVLLTGPYHAEAGIDIEREAMPPNVTVQPGDGSPADWVDSIARAQFVILPVVPDVIKPSGISTYLVAMALGKCVIITDGPATRGLIDDGQAVVVPPGDARALRDAIARVASDATFRERVAARGRAYASALGDEARFADDIVRCVGTLIDGARP